MHELTLRCKVHCVNRRWLDKGFPAAGLNNATYLACIEHFDTAKLSESTLIIFMSDNCGQYRVWNPKVSPVEPGQPVKLDESPSAFSNAPLRMARPDEALSTSSTSC